MRGRLDFDLSDRLDIDRDALLGVDVRQVDLERHHLERQSLVGLPARPDEGAAAAHDPVADALAFGIYHPAAAEKLLAAKDDQRFVGTGLLVERLEEQIDE